jgi:hypothetical protein
MRLKEMELQTLLCVECLPAVEKAGRLWVKLGVKMGQAQEKAGARRLKGKMGGFAEENMGNGST